MRIPPSAGRLRLVLTTGVLLALRVSLASQDIPFEEKRLAVFPEEAELHSQGVGEPHLDNLAVTGFPFVDIQGRQSAYIVATGNHGRVMLADEEGPTYDMVRFLVRSPDGRRVAYQAMKGDHWCVVLDGKEQEFHEDVMEVRFSPDGEHMAYLALTDGRWGIVLDGKRSERTWRGAKGVAFSPDGKRLAYAGNPGNGMWSVVVDDDVQREYDDIMGSPIFSADSLSFAYVAKAEGRQFAVEGATPRKPFQSIRGLAFLAKDAGIGYVGIRGSTCEIVAGTFQYAPYHFGSTPVLGKKKEAVFAGAVDGKVRIMRGDKKHKEFSQFGPEILHLELEPDTSGCVYIARDPEDPSHERVVVNSKEGPAFLRVYPRFWYGPKPGYALAYLAQSAEDKVKVVFGTRVSEPFDDVYPELHFDASGKKIAYCARRGREIWWIVQSR